MADAGDAGQCGLASGGSRTDRGDQGVYEKLDRKCLFLMYYDFKT